MRGAIIIAAVFAIEPMLRSALVGAAVVAAAVGFAATANADVGLVAGLGIGGVATSPGPFRQCPAGTYKNSDGGCTERPDQNPNGAIGQCCDGTDTHAKHRNGACSGHGGVCQWFAAAGSSGSPNNPANGPVDNGADSRFVSLLTDPDQDDPMVIWNFPLVKAQGLEACQLETNGVSGVEVRD